MSLRIIPAAEVRRLLPMADCIAVMAEAMTALSAGEIDLPDRVIEPLFGGSDVLILMPGAIRGRDVYGAKVNSLHPGNTARGAPTVQGVVLLFDRANGAPLAVVDGAAITTLRTAAASGLATMHLARPDVRSLGVLGAGVQARAHIEAVLAVRPSITEVLVWARRPEAAVAIADEAAVGRGVTIRAVAEAAEAAACDVVCAVTAAAAPVLKGAWLTAGSHLNLVGAYRPSDREADTAALVGARLFVDDRAAAMTEAGDILIPIHEGAFGVDHIVGEIGEVVAGHVRGRQDPAEVTAYKSLGSAAQDLYAAAAVLARARAFGGGLDVAF